MRKSFYFLAALLFLCCFSVVSKTQTVQITYNFIGDISLNYWYSDTCIVREMVRINTYLMVDKVDFKKKEVINQITEFNDFTRNTTNWVTTFKSLKKQEPFKFVKLTLSEDTRTIMDMECKHATVEDKGTIWEIWYAPLPDFKNLEYNFYSRYEGVPGVVLEEYMNGNLTMKAVKIERGKWCNCDWTDYKGF